MKPALLIETTRNNVIEKQHFGFVTVVDKKENLILKTGDDENKNFWLRSAAKPFQSSLIIETGAYDKFGFTLQELAVCCASHTGTEEHTKTVLSVLNKIGLKESHLQCGIHEPIDKKTRNSLIQKNLEPSQLHNNCSGKHAGMLAVCVANKWDIKNYLDLDHPIQKKIIKTVVKFCDFDENNINIGIDGCSAPVHALPVVKMGIGFLNLFLDKNYEKMKKSFQENPFLISGNERLDTEIIKASSGRLISKTAAGGLCITINLELEQAIIVKILDADMTARAITTIDALKQLKWLSQEEIENNELKNLYDLNVKNLKNQTVGEIIPKFSLL
ncbi:MAG: asparaginase [bacterium]